MDYGLILPTKRAGASPEAILATALTAERLGWRTLCGDDHILVPREDGTSYGRIYEILTTLAWLGGQTTRAILQPSVIVVPQRNAVVLAKELATIASLTGGRLVAGVGIGWNPREYANLGMAERFRARGAYLDETIALWRHLWSGSEEPFRGRFHQVEDAIFSPLPPGAGLPIIVGGRSDFGARRAGRLGDGYQLSQNGPAGMAARLPLLREAADEAGRPLPRLSARAPIYFGPAPAGATAAAIAGDAVTIGRVIDEWIALGLDELLIDLDETDPDRAVAKMERLHDEVIRPRLPAA